jgi:glutathione S-transferase
LLTLKTSFLRYAKERDLFAYHHYVEEVERLYGVLNTRLDGRDFLVGDKYSFADMVAFVAVDVGPVAGIDRSRFPNVYRWWKSIGSRPAVQAGSSVPFALPLIGQAYLQRLKDEPQFKKEEDEILDFVKKAKQQYGAGAHT